MKTVGIPNDAKLLAEAFKEVVGLPQYKLVRDAVWEKIGRLPKEQHEKVMTAYNIKKGITPNTQ